MHEDDDNESKRLEQQISDWFQIVRNTHPDDMDLFESSSDAPSFLLDVLNKLCFTDADIEKLGYHLLSRSREPIVETITIFGAKGTSHEEIASYYEAKGYSLVRSDDGIHTALIRQKNDE